MKVSGICITLLVCAVLLISGVSAQNIDQTSGYNVTQVKNYHLPSVVMPMIAGSISQGQTIWYYYSVSSGKTSFTADLNWENTANSLALTVVAPDGTIGPYYDTADGIKDGRVTLVITATGSLTPGTWAVKVYGDRVTGVQTYNLLTK